MDARVCNVLPPTSRLFLHTSKYAEHARNPAGMVRSCRTISVVINLYDFGGLVHNCLLRRISTASRGKDPEEWVKTWAQQLLTNDEGATSLDRDRKLCLELLYTLCNRWKGITGDVTITEDQKNSSRVPTPPNQGNLSAVLCMVMDRAKMLYFMTGIGKAGPGMHWYFKRHLEDFSGDLNEKVREYGGETPSINRRYLWLLDLKGLKLGQVTVLRRWTTPTK